MISFSVGNRWTDEFLERIAALNEASAHSQRQITELYGSLRSTEGGIGSVRPDYRLPSLPAKRLREYVARAHSLGLLINYTINAPLSESVAQFVGKRERMARAIDALVEAGVDIFSVANSLLIELVRERCAVPLELSSVACAMSTAQLPVYADWGLSAVCLNVMHNRDIDFLRAFQRAANDHGICTKLMVNEFCSFAGAPCHGIMQADCLLHSALEGNERGLADGWPFSRCAASRADASSWLKAPFILPQWLGLYEEHVAIRHFKITGRTCDTDWLLDVCRLYLEGSFGGDVRYLWREPRAPGQPAGELHEIARASLMSRHLDDIGFVHFWFAHPSFRCAEHCAADCRYCEDVARASPEPSSVCT